MEHFLFAVAHAQNRTQNESPETIGDTWERLGDFFSTILWAIPKFIFAIIFVVISIWVAKFLSNVVINRITQRMGEDDMHEEAVILIKRAVYAIIVTLGSVIALQIMGVTDLMSVVGFFGIGLGFAFKDLLANFIAGVVILTQKKFKIGDLVSVTSKMGHITEIEPRTTTIRDLDGTTHIVPNAAMLTEVVRNYTANSFRRIDVEVGIHYSDDIKSAQKAALDAVKKLDAVVRQPAPVVLAKGFGSSSITLEVRVWIESTVFWPVVQNDMVIAIKSAFDAHGITIPFPIRTIALDNHDQNLKQALNLK